MDNFMPLLQALDALFPIGAYALSGGMETYTQKGVVHDKRTLLAFLQAQLHLLPYTDLGIAALAARGEDFRCLDHLCAAMKQPWEIRTGSEKLCARFLKIQAALGEYSSLGAYRLSIGSGACDGHYPVAVGLLIYDLRAPQQEAIELYAYSLLSVMVNQAVKLAPLGQTDGQSALFESLKRIPEAVRQALSVSFDMLGGSGGGFDLRSMQHEILPGRLYSS